MLVDVDQSVKEIIARARNSARGVVAEGAGLPSASLRTSSSTSPLAMKQWREQLQGKNTGVSPLRNGR
jgi:hypothetical protein